MNKPNPQQAKRPPQAFSPQGASRLPLAETRRQSPNGAQLAGRKSSVGRGPGVIPLTPPQPAQRPALASQQRPAPPEPSYEMSGPGPGEELHYVQAYGVGLDGQDHSVKIPVIFPAGMRSLGARVLPPGAR